jgi:Gram-negative bacterial TonB protein C-terminal
MTRAPHLWLVPIRVDIGPDGAIRSCEVEATSGKALLDKRTCVIVRKRAKFAPAHWSDGSPAYGAFRTTVSWLLIEGSPDNLPRAVYPDLTITVKSLPSKGKTDSLVRAMFSVDEQGRVSSCIAEPGRGFEEAENAPSLVPVACDELTKTFTAVPAKDPTGRAIPSVQDALVLFSTR